MKAQHRRAHAAIWVVLGPGLLLLGLWALWSPVPSIQVGPGVQDGAGAGEPRARAGDAP